MSYASRVVVVACVCNAAGCAFPLCGDDGKARSSGSLPGMGSSGVILASDADVRALAGCTRVVGSLGISGATSLAGLESVRTIDGGLFVNTSSLARIALSGLTQIGGDMQIGLNTGAASDGNDALVDVTLTALETVGGGSGLVAVFNNAKLGVVSLPALTAAGDVFIAGSPALATLELTSLAHARGLNLEDAGGVAVSAPALNAVDDTGINCNGAVASIDMPHLATATGGLRISETKLTTLAFPALTTAGGVGVHGNATLSELDLPLLATASGPITIDDNPQLATCTGPLVTNVGDCAP